MVWRTGMMRFAAGVCAAGVVAASWLVIPGASADSRDEQVTRQREAASEAQKTRSELEGVNADLAEAVLHVTDLTSRLADAHAAEAQARATLAAAERTHQATVDQLEVARANLASTRSQAEKARNQAAREKQAIGSLARSEYLGASGRSAWSLLLGNETTGDFAQAAQTAGLVAQVHAREMAAAEARLARARTLQERLEALTTQIEDLTATAADQVDAAEVARAKAEDTTHRVADLTEQAEKAQADLEEKKSTLQADLKAAEAEQAAATAAIARIDEENRRNAEEAARLAAQKDAHSGSSMFASPLHHALIVTSPYGYRVHPVLGYRKLHMGVDLASACGEQQFASLGGRVVSTQWEGAGGNTVTINHGLIGGVSWVTKYRHMSQFAVAPGELVDQGQLIGYTGATGRVTGCHVHFEIWKNGVTIDPLGML